MRRPDVLLAESFEQIRSSVTALEPLDGAHPQLQREVLRFTDNLIAGRAAGE